MHPLLQKIPRNATCRRLAGPLLALCLSACASPPTTPRQVLEYQRHTTLGLEHHAAGQIVDARNAFQRALNRAELDDDASLIASALLNLGATELLLDDPAAAGRTYARAFRETALTTAPVLRWQALAGLAEATRRLGQPGKALDLLDTLPGDVQTPPMVRRLAEVTRARALLDRQAGGDLAAARQLLAAAADDASVLYVRALLLRQSGDLTGAIAAASQTLALDRQAHHPPAVADDHRLLGQLLAAQGDHPAAREHLERAVAIYAGTGQSRRETATRAERDQLAPPR